MSDFGIFAQDLKLKVTNEVKKAGRIFIIPCSMGFAPKKGSTDPWVNEWVDVVVFEGSNYELAETVEKGDKITVSGRMTMKEYNGKKSWQILCDKLEVAGKPHGEPVKQVPIDSVPF